MKADKPSYQTSNYPGFVVYIHIYYTSAHLFYLYILTLFKDLAIHASIPYVPLKHIYIYTHLHKLSI